MVLAILSTRPCTIFSLHQRGGTGKGRGEAGSGGGVGAEHGRWPARRRALTTPIRLTASATHQRRAAPRGECSAPHSMHSAAQHAPDLLGLGLDVLLLHLNGLLLLQQRGGHVGGAHVPHIRAGSNLGKAHGRRWAGIAGREQGEGDSSGPRPRDSSCAASSTAACPQKWHSSSPPTTHTRCTTQTILHRQLAHLHGHVVDQLPELLAAGHKVSLAVDLHQHTQAARENVAQRQARSAQAWWWRGASSLQ